LIGSFKDSEGDSLFSSHIPELFEMDGEQQTPSNETNTPSNETNTPSNETNTPSNETNTPSPVHLCSPALPADGRHPDARSCDFPDSSSSHSTSNLVRLSAQDEQLQLIKELLLLNSIMGFV
jgi:hypothetical protein